MPKPERIIHLLSHSRHDWLNVMQLIKGNISLNRLDRVEGIIEDVIRQARNEAKLSNLKIPKVAAELLTYNWGNHRYKLEFEIIGNIYDLSKYELTLFEYCQNFLAILDEYSHSDTENHVLITFHLSDGYFQLSFDFHGRLEEIEPIERLCNTYSKNVEITIAEKRITEEELFFMICIRREVTQPKE